MVVVNPDDVPKRIGVPYPVGSGGNLLNGRGRNSIIDATDKWVIFCFSPIASDL